MLILEKVLILKSVGIFSSVPEQSLVEIGSVLETVEVNGGKDIIRQDEMGTSMYILVDGRARIHRDGKTLAEVGSREFFGELAALDPEARAATVTAIEDSLLFRLEGERLYDLMSENIDMAKGIIQALCERVRSAGSIKPSGQPTPTERPTEENS